MPKRFIWTAPALRHLLGGILLVFPGFITDIVGALLLIPAVRTLARRKLAQAVHRAPAAGDAIADVIDLEPHEWHQIPDQRDHKRRRKLLTRRGAARADVITLSTWRPCVSHAADEMQVQSGER